MSPVALVFARCAGFAFRAPGFAHPSVPPPVRVALAGLLTLAIAPVARGAKLPADVVLLAPLFVAEFAIGSAIGSSAALLVDAAYAAGRAIDDFVGVKAIAPSTQIVAPSGFGRIWSLAYTGGFFVSGAYRPMLASFAGGFTTLPPGAALDGATWLQFGAQFARSFAIVALTTAAPAIACALIAQIALGALSRAVPRFGSLTLAFPLGFAAALLATVLAIPAIAPVALQAPLLPGRP